MAKDKLFTPEDFDKPIEKKWYQSKGLIIALIFLVVAIIVGLVVLLSSDKPDSVSNSSQPNVTETESVDVTENEITPSIGASNIEQEDASLSNPAEDDVKPEENPAEAEPIPAVVSSTTEVEALKVVRGEYGNVPQRKELLGNRYNEIQARVNQLKREGKF